MEHQKILNLLNKANHSKFVARKWNIANDNLKANYNAANEITYNAEVLKSSLCDYDDAYILVRGDITIIGHQETQVPFIVHHLLNVSQKTDETTIDGAENLDLVLPMYNLIEYSSIIEKQWEVYGFIQKIKQIILMLIFQTLIILNLSCIRLNY